VLHWQQHQRPICAETLRKRLEISTGTARDLVTQLRTDTHTALDEHAAQRRRRRALPGTAWLDVVTRGLR